MKMHVNGRLLEDFDSDPRLATWVAEKVGLSAVEGRRQRWSVGGHRLTVAFWLDPNVRTVLRVYDGWPAVPGVEPRRSLTLAETLAASVSQKLRILGGPEHAAWKCRALIESGIIPARPVEFRSLPDDALETAVVTWAAITSLARARWLPDDVSPGEPMPLVVAFLARWRGTEERIIQSGRRYLEKDGLIERAGAGPVTPFRKPMVMYAVAVSGTVTTGLSTGEYPAQWQDSMAPSPVPTANENPR